jgi:signal transduction histidine kinase
LEIAIVSLSIALQAMAAVYALRLIRVTGWWTAWAMIALALLIMAGRRTISLVHVLGGHARIDLIPELLALVISALMLVGVLKIGKLLRLWVDARRYETILRGAQYEFIAGTGPGHLEAFRKLAADLADNCRWDGVAIGAFDDAGTPELVATGGPLFKSGLDVETVMRAEWEVIRRRSEAGMPPDVRECLVAGHQALTFPAFSGSDPVGVVICLRRDGVGRTNVMEALGLAVGNMIGAVRFLRERENADRDQKRLIAALERSNRELEQFAYISSHDMQEPLRMIILYLELLQRRCCDQLSKDGHEYVAFAIEGARRMHSMILDLLDYCRLGRLAEDEAGRADARVALEVAKGQLAGHRAAIGTLPSPTPVAIRDNDLVRIFLNLLGNAIKFASSERAPEVSVHAEREDGMWHFRVADNGIGIDPAYFDKIFLVFQRLHTRDAYAGTGIGLAFVKKAVEGRGGRVWVDSSPGKGSTFHFTLPEAVGAEERV